MTDSESKTLLTDWVTVFFVLLRHQGPAERGLARRLPGNRSQQQQSASRTSSPAGDAAACADEVIGRLQQKAER